MSNFTMSSESFGSRIASRGGVGGCLEEQWPRQAHGSAASATWASAHTFARTLFDARNQPSEARRGAASATWAGAHTFARARFYV
jgi:hypothetical protein